MASPTPQQSPSSNSTSPPASPPPSSPPPESPPPQSPPPSSSPPPPSPPPSSPLPQSPPLSSSPPPASSPPPPSSSPPSSSPPPPSPPPPPSSPANNNSPPPPPQNDVSNSPPPPPQSNSPPPPHSSSSTPPPPPAALSPSSSAPPPPPSSSSDDSSSSSLSVNSPIVIGVAVGAGVLVMLLLLAIVLVCLRKKKKEPRYYEGGEYYSNNATTAAAMGNWSGSPPNQAPAEHVVRISPPDGGGSNWNTPPQPPSPITGSDGTTNNFGGYPPPPPPPGIALGFNKNMFTYEELSAATRGFSTANMIGQGGFGCVHKGVLPQGKEVAVKSLKAGSGQGEKEFQAEVEIISRVHHRHLVTLVGYCIAGGQRMLVYEFIPNKTLEHHLHGGAGTVPLDWTSRVKIALGSAKGLAYLHEDCHPRIIHRDIKSANILIDLSFEAKVADFGLAKLTSDNYTHVSTRIMGTFGYLAPEYASSGKLTEKSDVFSFGVVLLELITGRRPLDTANKYSADDTLVDWARPIMQRALEDGNFREIADPMMEGNYDSHNMMRMIACAASCIRHSARRRPKMSQIVRVLEGDVSLDDLSGGIKPPSSNFGSLEARSSSNSADQERSYGEDMKKFKKMASQSWEYTSSEYGATSEYGLDPSSSSDDSQVIRIKGNKNHKGSRRIQDLQEEDNDN